MNFGEALEALKANHRASRAGWNGRGMWIVLSPGFMLTSDRVFSKPIAADIDGGVGVFRPYLMMRTVDAEFVPWVASQTDILAEDWQVVPTN